MERPDSRGQAARKYQPTAHNSETFNAPPSAHARIVHERQIDGTLYVKLDGKRVGVIRLYPLGWQYKPRGGEPGDFFATLAECKQSLEDDQ